MKKRLFTLSVLALTLFLTGCNVPLVPIIQNGTPNNEQKVTEEPTHEIAPKTNKPLPYAKVDNTADKNTTLADMS